jgi:hypothetical protein
MIASTERACLAAVVGFALQLAVAESGEFPAERSTFFSCDVWA